MARKASSKPESSNSTATIGFEAKLWLTADTTMRYSASTESEATLPSLSVARGNRANNSIYGQDKWAWRQQPKQSNATTRRLAVMNLALRGKEADFGPEYADTFRRDLHPDLRADYVLATAERDSAFSNAKSNRRACRRQDNPMPFNDSDTALRDSAFVESETNPQVESEAKDNFRKDDDVRWSFGVPPKPARRNSASLFTRRQAAGRERSEGQQRQLRLGEALHLPPRPAGHGRLTTS